MLALVFSVRAVMSVFVPRFGSQQSSSQRTGSQTNPTETRSRCRRLSKRGNRRANKRAGGEVTRPVLKVKLPKLGSTTRSKSAASSSFGWIETTASGTDETRSRGEKQNVCTDSQSSGGNIYLFSGTPTGKATDKKDKTMVSVLRTMLKMLDENQLIRKRLATLSQVN